MGSETIAKRSKYRIAVLTCRSEDDKLRIYVVKRADGSSAETRDRDEASRLAKW